MSRMIKNIIIFLPLLLFSGCATIIHGDSQYVNIDSSPQGATVFIEGNSFITPAKVLLKRGYPLKEYQLMLQKAGYKPGYAKIEQRSSGWLWLNILNGIIPGITVDFITGAAFDLVPSEVRVILEESVK